MTTPNQIHGEALTNNVTAEYTAWVAMKARCYNQNHKSHPDYGGRGITVCRRWRQSYPAFLSDMGRKPDGACLERKNNARGYSPSNCIWATRQDQANNRRDNRLVSFGTTSLTLKQWSRKIGIGWTTIRWRLDKGWTAAKALTTPPRSQRYAKRN